MLLLNYNLKTLTQLPVTTLVDESILERYGLQAAIKSSWDSFVFELGMGKLHFIGDEVIPHFSCRDSIDILALDQNLTPIIIELKRDKNKLQLLQALSYAAMINTWGPEDYINRLQGRIGFEQLIVSLQEIDEMPSPKIILIAEAFDPEIILTADFLMTKEIEVYAISLQLIKYKNEIFVDLNRKFPLKGLDDSYVTRGSMKKITHSVGEDMPNMTWDDVKENLTYQWADKALKYFSSKGDGNPSNRYFGAIFKGSSFNVPATSIRSDHIKVFFQGRTPELHDKLEKEMKIAPETWGSEGNKRSGWAIRIRTEDEFDRFVCMMDTTR